MITVEGEAKLEKAPETIKRGKKWLVIIPLLLIIGFFGALYLIGHPEQHQDVGHKLYRSFDSSSEHKKLLSGLEKAKLAILVGKSEDALTHFVSHYANSQEKKNRNVLIERFGDENAVVDTLRDWHWKIRSVSGQLHSESDWILISENGQAVDSERLAELQALYPTSKILIVTTVKPPKV